MIIRIVPVTLHKLAFASCLSAAVLLGACSDPDVSAAATTMPAASADNRAVTAQRIQNAAGNNADWLTHGRTYAEDRFSL